MVNTSEGKNILWGVCGIGAGHVYRQLPLIAHFTQANKIMIFAYGKAFDVLQTHYRECPNVKIEKVAVPYYVGTKQGLDFAASAAHPANQDIDFTSINMQAMCKAQEFLETPDLVVSDYEPISAQFAYAYNAPLVTIDQQSKYLMGDFLRELNGTGFKDEEQRLQMFFPKAEMRLACSFFDVSRRSDTAQRVDIMPPVLRQDIVGLQRNVSRQPSFVVYMSAQNFGGQDMHDIAALCGAFPDVSFTLFGRGAREYDAAKAAATLPQNVSVPKADQFTQYLAECHGIISTAGHGLLSEAMYLGLPVLALPLPLYEQQMNAKIIADNQFGMAVETLDTEAMRDFIRQSVVYARTIKNDKTVLMRGDGTASIIKRLESILAP